MTLDPKRLGRSSVATGTPSSAARTGSGARVLAELEAGERAAFGFSPPGASAA